MTFQPPPDESAGAAPTPPPAAPPPPAPSAPPAPGGAWAPPPVGAPSGYPAPAGNGFDPKTVNRLDWAILGIGFLIFLFSFIDFYGGATISEGGHSEDIDGSASAWHDIFGGGFFVWFAMLFGIAGAVLVAIDVFRPQVSLPQPARLLGLGLFAAAALFEIIGIFVTPGDSEFGTSVSLDHGFGFWASLILILAGLVLSLARLQQTGGKLPQALNGIPNIGDRFGK